MVVLLIVGGIEHVYVSTVWSLFGLPALAIFVSALLVKLPPSKEVEVPPPTGTARKPKISKRALHDIAYISFMVMGLISLLTSYFVHSEIQAAGGNTGGVGGVLGFLVIIPFGIPLLLALILGPGLSMFLWRDYRLMTLTVLTIALLIALPYLGFKAMPMLLSLYAAVCMTISLVWFIKYRRRFG
jgi:hypothetical protein